MLQQIIWFTVGLALGKLVENTTAVKKAKHIAGKCATAAKNEFKKKTS
jgi:hypothetical protein